MKKNWRTILGTGALCGALAVTSVPTYALSSDYTAATYTGAGMTFTKVSHMDGGAVTNTTTDGFIDYVGNGKLASDTEENQGDRGQSYTWAAEAYGDWVYVGTTYGLMMAALDNYDRLESMGGNSNTNSNSNSLIDATISKETLDTLYNGSFFYEEEDGIRAKSVLLKINVKTGETKILMGHNVFEDYDGDGENDVQDVSCSLRNCVSYKGKIYFCGTAQDFAMDEFALYYPGLEWELPAIYEVDPTTDAVTRVYQSMGAGDALQAYGAKIATGIRGIAVYNDQLVISSVDGSGPSLLVSSDGRNFTQIAAQADLFNYPAYKFVDSINGGSIFEMVEFNNKLYISITTGTEANDMQSFAIVTAEQLADGSWKFTPLVGDQENDGARYTFGIDPERTRSGAATLTVFNDHLYIGEYNDQMNAMNYIANNYDFTYMAKNLEQSVGLYCMDKDENIELVVGDATTMFPNGGTSGLGSGFGDHSNQYIWRMQTYDNKLFVATFDTSTQLYPVTRIANSDILNMDGDEFASQMEYTQVLLKALAEKWQSKLPEEKPKEEIKPMAEEKEETVEEAKAEKSEDVEEVKAEKSENVEEVKAEKPEIEEEVKGEADDDNTNKGESSEEKAAEPAGGVDVLNAGEITPVDETGAQPDASGDAKKDSVPVTPIVGASLTDEAYLEIVKAWEKSLDVELTEEQEQTLVESMKSGAVSGEGDNSGLSLIERVLIQKSLEQLVKYIDSTDNEKFLQAYKWIYEQISKDENMNQELKAALLEVMDYEDIENLQAIIKCANYMNQATPGFDLYVSEDGVNFTAISKDGFGDRYNYGIRVFAETESGLFCGTANPFYGCQGWYYQGEAKSNGQEASNGSDSGSSGGYYYGTSNKKAEETQKEENAEVQNPVEAIADAATPVRQANGATPVAATPREEATEIEDETPAANASVDNGESKNDVEIINDEASAADEAIEAQSSHLALWIALIAVLAALVAGGYAYYKKNKKVTE